ncbi:hypothetical protein [Capnocytophaga leadbetteri]|uniref:hypothetical protein n=1 Tax=Capnocytophaga leadbetteri TaxID=327575 RepID=UPI0028E96DF7|nr:hypothetical protein [Capnocytophaga leadbetteri]
MKGVFRLRQLADFRSSHTRLCQLADFPSLIVRSSFTHRSLIVHSSFTQCIVKIASKKMA